MEIGIKAIPYNRVMRKAREKQNLTQRQLADLVGISQQTISMIERLCRPVNEQDANEIALVLGCDVDHLFPPETRNFKSKKSRSVEFVMDMENLDSLPAGEWVLPSPESIFLQGELATTMKEVLETLPFKEQQVIFHRFGLEDDEPKTLEEIGAHFGVNGERIRQIEAKAIRRLRHPIRSKKLRGYLSQ